MDMNREAADSRTRQMHHSRLVAVGLAAGVAAAATPGAKFHDGLFHPSLDKADIIRKQGKSPAANEFSVDPAGELDSLRFLEGDALGHGANEDQSIQGRFGTTELLDP